MPRGKTSQFREGFPELARKLCLLGAVDRDLARVFEVSERTINRWKRQHPEFADALLAGKAEADGAVAEALYRKAVKGEMSAISFWLRNRWPDHWRDGRGPARRPDKAKRGVDPAPVGSTDHAEREVAKAILAILQRVCDAAG
jgi:hypothetical protein